MAGTKMALDLVERATPAGRFRVAGSGQVGSTGVDGPALARRRREHRRGYQARSCAGERFDSLVGTMICIGAILLLILVAAALIGLAWIP